MTRTAQILALLSTLVAFAAISPAASAADFDKKKFFAVEPSGIRHGSVDPNPFRRIVDPNPFRHGSYQPQRRHFR